LLRFWPGSASVLTDTLPRLTRSRSFAPPFAWPLGLSAVSLIEVSSSPTQRLAQSATVAMHSA